MNIINENEKWVSNMISILFCAVVIKFLRFFNDETIVCDIIFFFASLIHFVILKVFLNSFLKFALSLENRSFYTELLFCSFDRRFSRTSVTF